VEKRKRNSEILDAPLKKPITVREKLNSQKNGPQEKSSHVTVWGDKTDERLKRIEGRRVSQ